MSLLVEVVPADPGCSLHVDGDLRLNVAPSLGMMVAGGGLDTLVRGGNRRRPLLKARSTYGGNR